MCQGWGRLDLKLGENEVGEHAELRSEKDGDDTLLNRIRSYGGCHYYFISYVTNEARQLRIK